MTISPDPSHCPQCKLENIYPDGSGLWICPDCSHEWTLSEESIDAAIEDNQVRDAYGNILQDGDSVSIIKDLKVKGASSVVKVGTKVKNIRLTEGEDGHNISCKIEGFGAMNLKSEFVKKA